MERFVIRNYGPSRNLPDGHGSYIFMERDRTRPTSDPKMAALFSTYPEVSVTERGENFVDPHQAQVPFVAPPVEPEEIVKKPTYDDLTKRDLIGMAKLRDISTSGFTRDDLIEALRAKDKSDADPEIKSDIDYEVLGYKDLKEIAKERGIRSVGVSKALLIELLQEDDDKD